ncbi:MAG: 2Fe-2S iron-sulfur cluster binding domain-containing protein [Pegethrix bostrychoides GSE-TBD4-15B]|jgi:hypothetical protein|uniref:2Fe-2S iron-sulfur cluster binding domain-containing protein n=1 Tax=Pegethrix bostrychoides GSE-TBD4-15B TaxID=2839662 RepID=A0A951U715_9CYAN|nr:2Fe-2S iron-sulfur cluster binding domain-containing protein [Pegethrix bostrychoides GSE-TBD4-15B]
MLEDLKQIQSPISRMIVAAAAAGSIVTCGAAIALGVTPAKSESAYKTAVYAALIAAGGGALAGLALGGTGKPIPPQRQTEAETVWKDWRNFVVVRKVKESEEITSFYLAPEDGKAIPSFLPGQFLTIKLEIPGQPKPIIRTYSLSDYTSDHTDQHYRLSIKREPMPAGLDVPPGVASNFMHDSVQAGSIIPAKPPSGKFFIDPQKALPAVLISNGVGITPMISMAKACSRGNSNRPIWFLHGARDGAFHAFRDEVSAIAGQNPNLRVHFRYSRPKPEDAGYYQSIGYVDAELVQQTIAEVSQSGTAAEYFLCGSPAFLQSLRDGLRAAGVPDEQVFFESFGGAKTAVKADAQPAPQNGTGAEIVFAKSGRTLNWQPGDGTILEFAEANDLNPEHSCRQGICLTCMCNLQEGEVEYETPPIGEPDAGAVLICISQPKTPRVVLDL